MQDKNMFPRHDDSKPLLWNTPHDGQFQGVTPSLDMHTTDPAQQFPPVHDNHTSETPMVPQYMVLPRVMDRQRSTPFQRHDNNRSRDMVNCPNDRNVCLEKFDGKQGEFMVNRVNLMVNRVNFMVNRVNLITGFTNVHLW